MNTLESLKYFLPETFLLAGAFLALLTDLFVRNKKALGVLALLVLGGTAYLSVNPKSALPLFDGNFTLDSFTHFFRLLALGVAAVTILISFAYRQLLRAYEGEYYSLLLFLTFGLILMSASTNLLMIFLSFEFVSIMSYLLTGFLKKDARSKEASLKYLLFGSLASALMLFGMTLLFGAAGSLELSVIQKTLVQPEFRLLIPVSLVLLLAGAGFKTSLVPFHFWAPDVYEAAPTPVTAFLTVAPKAAGFALLMRILFVTYGPMAQDWRELLAFLSVMTMTVGNVIAISQTNIKRLLAYSSIAQAGYILMGLAAGSRMGIEAIPVYFIAYAFTNLGAFTAVIGISNTFGNDEMQSYSGLSRRSPFLAACLTFFLLSLAGIPPTAGFIGKFYVFAAALQVNYYFLALAAAINSAIAAFYYFKVVRLMYLTPKVNEEHLPVARSLYAALAILLAGTLIFGLFPGPFISLLKNALPF